jgi:hypothetical protein
MNNVNTIGGGLAPTCDALEEVDTRWLILKPISFLIRVSSSCDFVDRYRVAQPGARAASFRDPVG